MRNIKHTAKLARAARRLRRDFSDAALRNIAAGTMVEIRKLERAIEKANFELAATRQALKVNPQFRNI